MPRHISREDALRIADAVARAEARKKLEGEKFRRDELIMLWKVMLLCVAVMAALLAVAYYFAKP